MSNLLGTLKNFQNSLIENNLNQEQLRRLFNHLIVGITPIIDVKNYKILIGKKIG